MMSYDHDFLQICRNRKEINESFKALKQGLFLRFLIITWYRLLRGKNQRFKAGNVEKLAILSQTEFAE